MENKIQEKLKWYCDNEMFQLKKLKKLATI